MTREEALTMIIASIAMEELALSHILNAEGEKLQYVLGTPGRAGSQQKRHRPGRGGDAESDAVEKQAGKGAGVLPGSAPL